MHNKDKYFRGQHADEELICFFRQHWITLARDFLYVTIFMAVLALTLSQIEIIKKIVSENRELKMLFFIVFCLSTAYMHYFFIKMMNYFVNVGVITDMRIIDHHKTLFFTDSLDSIDMAQIQNIEKIQVGILQNLLQFGDIKLFLSASDSIKTFHNMPNPRFHFRCIYRQKEARKHMMSREAGHVYKSDHQILIPMEERTIGSFKEGHTRL